ncbi:hypothetical protein [Aquimarina rubra]|uniref:Uncharacterized protein n=1 Tax=Aquimarina rubra TaxID=1920033 RepID=A0ABW5LFP0_9FLAO
MAANTIILDGDTVVFDPAFGNAIVTVKPGKIKASGKSTVQGKKIAVKGDELQVEVSGCSYITPNLPQAGTGTLSIQPLTKDHLTSKTTSGGIPIIRKGNGSFKAKFVFDPGTPAKLIPPSGPTVLDTKPFYEGTGRIIPNKDKVKAT